MVKKLGLALVVVFSVCVVIGVGLSAVAQQTPLPSGVTPGAVVPAVNAHSAPGYTEAERLMVQLVQVSDQLATCRQQLGTKGVTDLSQEVRARIEAQHPGFTVDWKTGALVPKAAPPK